MCSGGPARVHALKNMIQHSTSSFNFNEIRAFTIDGTPSYMCLKTTDQNHNFFNFQPSDFSWWLFSSEMNH